MELQAPMAGTYPAFYKSYIDRVSGKALKPLAKQQEDFIRSMYTGLSPATARKGYQKDKWSLNQLLGHILDTEKIMHFRALCISRGEQAGFPDFDQDAYVQTADFNALSPQQLLRSFLLHRELLKDFLEQVPAGIGTRQGTVSGRPMSVSALIHIIYGHTEHHIHGIRTSYRAMLPPDLTL